MRITDNGQIEIDGIDKQIINFLVEGLTPTVSEISNHIGISNVAVHQRIKKLSAAGIIENKISMVNWKKLGYKTVAFIGVFLDKSSQYKSSVQFLEKIPEIIEAHFTTGNYAVFLKIRCRDNEHLMQIINNKIQGIEGIIRTETIISLEQNIQRQLKL